MLVRPVYVPGALLVEASARLVSSVGRRRARRLSLVVVVVRSSARARARAREPLDEGLEGIELLTPFDFDPF